MYNLGWEATVTFPILQGKQSGLSLLGKLDKAALSPNLNGSF